MVGKAAFKKFRELKGTPPTSSMLYRRRGSGEGSETDLLLHHHTRLPKTGQRQPRPPMWAALGGR